MKLMAFKKSKKAQPTFVGMSFDKESLAKVITLARMAPNPVPDKDLHITVIYSNEPIQFTAQGRLDKPLKVKPRQFSIFTTAETKCLVLEVTSPELVARHKLIMSVYGASYDHPHYKPHISLSYDIGDDFDLTSMPDVETMADLYVDIEYSEKLDSNWTAKA